MEGNFLFEIDEVLRNVQEAEVMSIFFPSFPQGAYYRHALERR